MLYKRNKKTPNLISVNFEYKLHIKKLKIFKLHII